MKKFNYDLFDNRKDLIEQDNSGSNGRMYHAPNGTYPSITNLLYEIVSKAGIQAWRNKVGHEKAQRISTKASIRGSKIHNVIEKYMLGDEDYLQGVAPEHIELVKLALPQIDERIDNIRGIELPLWSDGLKTAGTTDLIAEYEGELAVIDWKTATYIKKEEYILPYILQGTAYARMIYEMYGVIPKKIVLCMLIRFDGTKYNPLLDTDILVDWRVFDPLDYIHKLKEVCDAYHFKYKT